jgi:hypothetical protein
MYYACLGLGYMMAEIGLIQKFVYYLADPVYANTIVITVLLVFSGLGSVVSGRFASNQWVLVSAACAGIGVFSAFMLFGMPPLMRATLGLPLAARAFIAMLLIAPLGLALGVPFPAGLSSLSRSRPGFVPWAWGMNGALSVSGAVLSRVLSVSLGFSAVAAVTVALYLAAAAIFPTNEQSPRRSWRHSSQPR